MSIACFTTSPIVAYYLYIKGKCALNEWLLWCLKLNLQKRTMRLKCVMKCNISCSYLNYKFGMMECLSLSIIEFIFSWIISNRISVNWIIPYHMNVVTKKILSLQSRELLRYIISKQSQFILLCKQIWYANNEGIAFSFVSFYCTPIYFFWIPFYGMFLYLEVGWEVFIWFVILMNR